MTYAMQNYGITVYLTDDGTFEATCLAYPYIVTDGDSYQDALNAIISAIEMEQERSDDDLSNYFVG